MVSFECLACHDVVTKPKLDQHRSRCHRGFDCLDCAKTFETPAEYKGHTSCISEAQKYQKSLYKPKTKGINSTNQSDSLSDKSAHNIRASPQSNAQWNRNSQATSLDNVNGYPGAHYQHQQNGWRNERDNHRYGDRGRKSSGWQQNKFARSSASGANDTPLGVSRRPSIDDQTGVTANGGDVAPEPGNGKGVSQENCRTEETEVKGKPKKEKRIRKVTDDCSPQTGKEKSAKPSAPKAEENSAVVNNDDEERKAKKRKKKVANGEAGPETGIAEADTDMKEKIKKEKKRREKAAQDLLDAAGSENKKKTKKEKKHREANGEPNSVGAGDAGSDDKKKTRKEKKRDADDDDEISAAVDPQTTKTEKRKKAKTDSEMLVVAADDVPVRDQTKRERDTIATDVDKSGVESKKKRKRLEHNDDTKKRRKHS